MDYIFRTKKTTLVSVHTNFGDADRNLETRVHANHVFKVSALRGRNFTLLELKLDQTVFGVEGDKIGGLQRFIKRLEITTRPSDHWVSKFKSLRANPSVIAPEFMSQESNTYSALVTLPNILACGFLHSRATSTSSPAFGFSHARINPQTGQVAWPWGLYKWSDGSDCNVDGHFWETPSLPEGLDPKAIHYNSSSNMDAHSPFQMSASWEIENDAFDQQDNIVWHIEMEVDTAQLKQGILVDTFVTRTHSYHGCLTYSTKSAEATWKQTV